MAYLESSKLKKIHLKKGDFEIAARERGFAGGGSAVPLSPAPRNRSTKAQRRFSIPRHCGGRGAACTDAADGTFVTSPLVGTFFASPAPDQPSFVKVGDRVEADTVVCIVEAMKVMNEVKANVSGTVSEILVENAHPVEFGTKIFRVVSLMQKVLIANRGEIAVRIIRACHDLGLQTVAVYSEADADALHVHQADEAVCIGEAPSNKSYLKIANIISACEITGADAVHPGYGFLSENANFASICVSCGLLFIGPPPQAIAALGDKARAKEIARSVRCPVIPGSDGVVRSVEAGLKEARKFGFPIFIKAVAGGGGKGIRIAYSEEDFMKKFVAAQAEAEASFNNPDVYLEKMILNPRHIEVQVAGDEFGNYLYLGERDCTIQRRRQKLIEEAPSPCVNEPLRKKMGQAAVDIVRAAKYRSVGTVEFLLDPHGNFYFLEVNTRIQVEHTVTEELTGIDLVEWQIRIARGRKTPDPPERRQIHRPCHRDAHQRRKSPRPVCAEPGTARALCSAGRPACARRQRLLWRLPHSAELRFDDRQAHRPRPHAQRGDRARQARAQRFPYPRRSYDDPVSSIHARRRKIFD